MGIFMHGGEALLCDEQMHRLNSVTEGNNLDKKC